MAAGAPTCQPPRGNQALDTAALPTFAKRVEHDFRVTWLLIRVRDAWAGEGTMAGLGPTVRNSACMPSPSQSPDLPPARAPESAPQQHTRSLTGEVCNLAGAGLAVEALGVTFLTECQRHAEENLQEIPCAGWCM